ncbi:MULTISPECIES: CoA transferase [Sphingobium]|uniref:2-methylfumaryl-CoA isomerase n=1 Tax=Sphingobium fuliginis (strain ATCC 27551) TaxID=336203 RepID=A0ABQ1EVV6_SPHSA|nr:MULTISPECIES: CoA transferase [Sphingobium]AJR25618.1 carnitine dehydratase [Sphingobium sp. YBL2]RYL98919.1 carnitine dehydratase [Sphingobium fuliginis]UXC92257.1 CoA transferase [Sphingobium sp. RSMS]WDA37730.1 CoA transferase [Sphingobium sp. YC-XJ3]GFZ87879.1 2-methylfumaryl-CoA isomerase [Sphingobium fuliginis]
MYDLLKGLRVVEGAAFIAGPSCGLHLAQMGAEVIRFDAIGGGPDYRRWPVAASGDSLYWEGLNKGKKSIAIDLGRPEGRELAVALATAPGDNAGLFLTNYPVKGFLSHEALAARRADIITVRVMGWADGSPAVDYTINAAVGVPQMTGPADDERPVNHVLPAWDLLGGAYAAFALTSALLRRRTSGQGAEIRVPLSDLAASSLSHLGSVAEVLSAGDRPRMGNDLFGAFGRDFITADGKRLIVVAITPRQWSGLLKTLDLSDAVAAIETELGTSFARDEGARFTHRARLFPLFEVAFAGRTAEALKPAFDAGGVTWGEYQTLHRAVTTDARLFTANPLFETLTHPSGLSYPTSGPAGTLANEARGPVAIAPKLGQHTDEVLATVLGLDSGAIGRLHDEGLVA